MSFKQQLTEMGICQEALHWVRDRTLQQAWSDCPRGDWMLFLLEKMMGKEGWLDKKEIMLLGCGFARRVIKYVPEEEKTILREIEAKERWTRGNGSKEDMLIICDSAYTAAWCIAWKIEKNIALSTLTRDKELLIQADYIRTQFTPPV